MIKVNEIRIGNLFQGEKFSIARYGIHSDGVTSITGYGIYLLSVDDNILDLKPIPLTEEWLLKLGFKQITTNEYWFVIPLKDRSLAVSTYGNVEISSWDRLMISHGCICEYVHKVQNLYFALTGEELQINQ